MRLGFEIGFIEQTPVNVAIIVGAIEPLLKTPVQTVARQRSSFHRLEVLECGGNAGVVDRWAAPVLLQVGQPLCKVVLVGGPNEITAIFSEHLKDIGIGVPAERTPDRLVD